MTYEISDPGQRGAVVAAAPAYTPAEVDSAVAATKAAGPGWAELSLDQRAALLTEAADAAAMDTELADLLTRENGKVLGEAQFELATFGAVAHVFAAMAPAALAPIVEPNGGELHHEPFGVVAAILPFNWPASVLISKLAPALLAGNTVVVKPPPTCPLTVLALIDAMNAVLPPGVVTVVNGPGVAVAEQLVAQPDVAMISLTGGEVAGRAVAQGAAARLAPVLLELGGNDAGIVLPDVEPTDALAARLLDAAFVTAGQVCMALKRLYVPQAQLAAFTDALIAHGDATVVTGYGLDPEATVGPVHTAAAAARVTALLADGPLRRVGVFHGGDGNYVHAAIVGDADPTSLIVTEEQFAPVLPVVGYATVDDAVTAANASRYGLGASVWSNDDPAADAVASRLEAGTVFRNNHGPNGLDPSLPFGGWKQSGIGREYGADGIRAYTQARAFPPRGVQL